MSEYIRTNKFDTNECPNIFVKEKLIRTNVRIYIRDQYIRIFEYSNIFVTLWSDLWVRMSVTPPPLWNLTDVMLANEDTNSMPTYNANRAIEGNACDPTWWPTCETMLVVHEQIFNQSKLCHQVAKFATNASGAMLLPNLVQVTESISGSVVPLATFVSRIWLQWYCNWYWHCIGANNKTWTL